MVVASACRSLPKSIAIISHAQSSVSWICGVAGANAHPSAVVVLQIVCAM
jgi:hypothetical protein